MILGQCSQISSEIPRVFGLGACIPPDVTYELVTGSTGFCAGAAALANLTADDAARTRH